MKKLYRAEEVVVLMASFADMVRNYPVHNDEMDKTLKCSQRYLEESDHFIDLVRGVDNYADNN